MHFSKEYSQLLLTLPPTLAENAIQYREVSQRTYNCINKSCSDITDTV
jgi:hypothetical protein